MRTALDYLDDLKDDAAVHIWPDDLAKCQTSECVVSVYSVRMGSPDGKTVPLFSREQVQAALQWQAEQQKGETDPLDMPLPCDITVGHVTMSKGVPLRSLVFRMKALYELAQEAATPHGVPPGYVLVPVEPTEEMIEAAKGGNVVPPHLEAFFRRGLLGNWRDMLSSLPQAPQGEQWISVHERLPELNVDNEDDGVKVYTWDGEFVTEDVFAPEYEQPAGPAVGGWLRTGDWFCSDTAARVTHWMLRRQPAPPPLAQGDSQ